ncbi:MAG: hypothetical protein H6R24_373 [Proteobacteria bacterium]|nr:hypothetical protein [Pseudomonadota bacterium]
MLKNNFAKGSLVNRSNSLPDAMWRMENSIVFECGIPKADGKEFVSDLHPPSQDRMMKPASNLQGFQP